MDRITIKQALRRGFWTVNAPVMAIMFCPWLLLLADLSATSDSVRASKPEYEAVFAAVTAGLVVASLVSIPAAWIWWSSAIPKWKLWAYSRVDNVSKLKIAATDAGLIWPDGHFFEKTELCPDAMRRRIRALEGRL